MRALKPTTGDGLLLEVNLSDSKIYFIEVLMTIPRFLEPRLGLLEWQAQKWTIFFLILGIISSKVNFIQSKRYFWNVLVKMARFLEPRLHTLDCQASKTL